MPSEPVAGSPGSRICDQPAVADDADGLAGMVHAAHQIEDLIEAPLAQAHYRHPVFEVLHPLGRQDHHSHTVERSRRCRDVTASIVHRPIVSHVTGH